MSGRAIITLPINHESVTDFVAPKYSTNSILFDGVDESIQCGTTADIQFADTDPYSISFWAKHSVSAGFKFICGTWDAAADRGYGLSVDNLGRILVIFDAATGGDILIRTTSGPLLDGEWHNIVATYSGSTTAAGFTIYSDGVSQTISTLSDSLGPETGFASNFVIGATADSLLFYDGNLDEVAIYDAELSQSEVDTIYGGGKPASLTSISSIIHHWRCGDGAGDSFPTIVDQEGSLNGTMTNMEAGDIVTDVP